MSKNENMRIWEKVCETDPSVTKGANLGRMSITAIGPQSQRKVATKLFGPYGIGWGVRDEHYEFFDVGDTKICSYRAILWYKDAATDTVGAFPITADVKVAYMTKGYGDKPGYLMVDDEYSKKVSTNALTKGLSCLGFNSDVFEGKFDDCKYVQAMAKKFAEPITEEVPPQKAALSSAAKEVLAAAAEVAPKGIAALKEFWGKCDRNAHRELLGTPEWEDMKGVAERADKSSNS